MLSTTPPGHQKHPSLDSNQVQDLRRVSCCPLHHWDVRADDWIRTSIIRPSKSTLSRPAPYSVEPRRQKQECKESNPAGRFWRPLASQKHTPEFKGIRRELNPYLLLHRQVCLPRTPRTPLGTDRPFMAGLVSGKGGSRTLKAC